MESSGILSLHHFLVFAWCLGPWFSAAQRVHALTFRSQSYEETGWLSPIPNPSFWGKESDWSTVGQLSNLVELAVAVGQGLLQQKLGCTWQWEEKGIVRKKGQNYCELCWHPSDSCYKGCMPRAWQTQDRGGFLTSELLWLTSTAYPDARWEGTDPASWWRDSDAHCTEHVLIKELEKQNKLNLKPTEGTK